LSVEALQRGDIAAAKNWADRSTGLGERTRYPPARSLGLMLSSFAMAVAGDGATALAEAEAAFEASAGHTERLCASSARAVALLVCGRVAEASQAFEDVYRDIDSGGFRALLIAVEVPRCAALAAGGHMREGINALEQAIGLFARWRNSRLLAWAHVVLGDLHLALVQAPRLSPLAMVRDPGWAKVCLTARATARRHYEAAAHAARTAETPGFLMQALIGLGLPPLGPGGKDDQRLAEARTIAASLGATAVVERIDRSTS
jgi:hypothetical protein